MKQKHKLIFVLFFLMLCSATAVQAAHADVPVVDLSHSLEEEATVNTALELDQGSSSFPVRSTKNSYNHETMDQKVSRLDKQVTNLTEMNYASKLEKLQLQLQQLQGQLEVQHHDLSQLKEQMKNFYQDLDQRVNQVSSQDDNKKEKTLIKAEKAKEKAEEEKLSDAPKSDELQKYEAAFNLLNKKEYDKAIHNFQAFVKAFPDSTYTANAHYWLGEIYYLKGKSESASNEFQIIVNKYPENTKVADAMLKIGLIAMDSGDKSKAKQAFTKVKKQFPGTTAGKIASLRLKAM